MTPQDWQRVKEIVYAFWDQEAQDRDAYLERACVAEPSLRSEIESLIAAHRDMGSFIEASPLPRSLDVSASNEIASSIGQRVGRYVVLEEIGRGAMGVVFKAEDTTLLRKVALKFLPVHSVPVSRALERFQREARSAASLNHPNICTIYEVGQDEGRHFIAMELIEGQVLSAGIPGAGYAPALVLRYALEISAALAHAHQHGIIHRDIKPSNIMFTSEGRVKVLDFGLAKIVDSGGDRDVPSRASLTQAGTVLGTLHYMSPEALRGEETDARGDIWSIGVVLFELVTGHVPFHARSGFELSAAILTQPLPPCPETVPESLRAIIDRCLQKEPRLRYQSGTALYEELKRVGDKGAVRERSASPRYRLRAAWLCGVALVLMLAFLSSRVLASWYYGLRMPTERTLAVLPYADLSGGPDGRALSEGLQDSLSAALSDIERFHGSLRVTPAGEVRGLAVNTPAAARRAFNVRLVLSGSVQREGNKVRVTSILTDAREQKQIGSRTLVIDSADSLPAEQRVARQAADLLGLNTHPDEDVVLAAGGTHREGAYESYLEGRGYLDRYDRAGNLDRAIDRFRSAIAEDHGYALGYSGLSEAYWRKHKETRDTGLLEMAEEAGRRAVEIDPKIAMAHVNLGQIYSSTGQYDAAEKEFRIALQINRVVVAAYRGLAGIYAQAGKPGKAEETYQQAVLLRPDDWVTLTMLGKFYFSHGQIEQSKSIFERIAKLVPDSPLATSNLGDVYAALNQFPSSEKCYRTSLAIQPTARAYVGLADLYFEQGKFAESVPIYEKALEITGKVSYTVLGKLAQAYQRTPAMASRAGEYYNQAAEVAGKAISINPRDAQALGWRAIFLARSGQKVEAIRAGRDAIAIAPSDVEVVVNAAIAFEVCGDHHRASDAVRLALRAGYPLEALNREPDLASLRTNQLLRKF